jgi:hypothetical protein
MGKYAVCQDCGREMNGVGCTFTHIDHYGKVIKRSTEHFDEDSGFCHDCGAKHGETHHLGCDVERCPICRDQMGCGCFGDLVQLIRKG